MTDPQNLTVFTAPTGAPLRFRDRVRARVGTADLLMFRIGDEHFALDLLAVEETVESPQLHAVPEAPPSLLGVFPHRAQFIPLYHTARVLDVADREWSCGAALVMRAGSRRLGLAVSDIEDVISVEFTSMREVPEGAWTDEILLGILVRDRQVVGVIDARALITACQTPPVPEAL